MYLIATLIKVLLTKLKYLELNLFNDYFLENNYFIRKFIQNL